MKKFLALVIALGLVLAMIVPVVAEEPLISANPNEGQLIHGFKLIREEEIPDINSTAIMYEHVKTGAHVLWLKNDDPFKVFAACFKTKPQDDTGAPHVVEHALLGGSRKYKSNDVFMDMDAISTNAFMNAMTYPDKTIFPVASRDPQDFANLTDLYLDSVFFPSIKTDKRIFDQEGWHYEIFDKDEPIIYKGVVYNEMMGADSNPIRLLFLEVMKSIFPDTTYANNSGGKPEFIPELSYENFLKFFDTYYNPSNVLLYFYGDVDMDYFLEHMDTEYLSHFDKHDVKVEYEKQAPFNEMKEVELTYNIPAGEDTAGQTYLSYNIVCGDGGNALDYFKLGIISDVLVDAGYAPIQNALQDAGIGQGSGSFWMAYNQNSFGVVALNAEPEQKDDFVAIVDSCLQEAAKGIDPVLLQASINKYELSIREGSSSNGGLRGMDYLDLVLDSYNYGADPLQFLHFNKIFEELRAGVSTGMYEAFIQEKLLGHNHKSLVVMKPEPGLTEKKDAEMVEKLAAYKASLSDEELEALIAENIAAYEAKGSQAEWNLPILDLKKIETDFGGVEYETVDIDGVTLLYSEQPSSGIVNVDMQFDLSVIEPEKVPYAVLLSYLLGALDTENYSYNEVELLTFLTSGGFGFGTSNAEHTKTHELDSRFTMSGSALAASFPDMLELMEEVALRSKIEDIDWIGYLISALRRNAESKYTSDGTNLGFTRVRALFSPMFAYRDMMSGLGFLRFLQQTEKTFRGDPITVLNELREVYETLINKKGLVIGLTCDKEDYEPALAAIKEFLKTLPNRDLDRGKFEILSVQGISKEGLGANSNVNYVFAAGDLKKVMSEVGGSSRLVANILNNRYLYPELRQKGGAYGGGSLIDNYGNFVVYSYRDPNIEATLDVYRKMGDFLKNLELTQDDLDLLIIGYFKSYPVTSKAVASSIVYNYINGLTNEDIKKEAEEVLAATPETVKQFGDAITSVINQNYYCVIGKMQQVYEAQAIFDKFDTIVPLGVPYDVYVVQDGDTITSITDEYYGDDLTYEVYIEVLTANEDTIDPLSLTVEPGTEFLLPIMAE